MHRYSEGQSLGLHESHYLTRPQHVYLKGSVRALVSLCPLDIRISVCVCVRACAVYLFMCGLCAVFTAIIISAACVYFSVAAPQITSLFNIRKCICKESILNFHCRKNRNDQLLERTINKLLCY